MPVLRGFSGTALAMGLFFVLPTRRRRQFRGLLALCLFVAMGTLAGCGNGGSTGSGGGGTTTTPGTTTGTYVVTVTATPAGATAQTATVNVTVN